MAIDALIRLCREILALINHVVIHLSETVGAWQRPCDQCSTWNLDENYCPLTGQTKAFATCLKWRRRDP